MSIGASLLRFSVSAQLVSICAAQSPHFSTFATGCDGSLPASHLAMVDPPRVGGTLRVDLDRLPANVAVMLLGASRTNSPFGPLPLALTTIGMPGCFAHTSSDAALPLSGFGNRGTHTLPIPFDSRLIGARFYEQALVLDPAARNAVGAVMSDAAEALIGLISVNVAPANMVPISQGWFQMGSTVGDPEERPVHPVAVTRPFWMGRFEVTQFDYQTLMGNNPSQFLDPLRPVENVTWYAAVAYCAALTRREAGAGRLPAGYQYRLPTEAEWEYCCRAGTTTEWSTSSNPNCRTFNHNHCIGQTTQVGSAPYAVNPWGLYDMHGNVYEWCLDAKAQGSNYGPGPVLDPYVAGGPQRILRGGAWNELPYHCRSSKRVWDGPSASFGYIGFRVVLAPIAVPSDSNPIPNMALIPAGSFSMGSITGATNERPVHTVTITRPFWIGKWEVTQAEYRDVMNLNPSNFRGANLPVDTVSWNDAMRYCAALTMRETSAGRLPIGYAYRLPTEAEWEYCCRAGTTTEFSGGNVLLSSDANHQNYVGQTTLGGSYAANPWGLRDMHGNVWEWCLDSWDTTANYTTASKWDPVVSSGSSRLMRGGCWNNVAGACRSAYRGAASPTYGSSHQGFRVVLAPVLP